MAKLLLLNVSLKYSYPVHKDPDLQQLHGVLNWNPWRQLHGFIPKSVTNIYTFSMYVHKSPYGECWCDCSCSWSCCECCCDCCAVLGENGRTQVAYIDKMISFRIGHNHGHIPVTLPVPRQCHQLDALPYLQLDIQLQEQPVRYPHACFFHELGYGQ